MKLLWTPRAADDLEHVVEYIAADNETAAIRVANRIVDRLSALSLVPMTGRAGEVPGTREVVLTPYPYVAIYEIVSDRMRVLHIRHGARDMP